MDDESMKPAAETVAAWRNCLRAGLNKESLTSGSPTLAAQKRDADAGGLPTKAAKGLPLNAVGLYKAFFAGGK